MAFPLGGKHEKVEKAEDGEEPKAPKDGRGQAPATSCRKTQINPKIAALEEGPPRQSEKK